MTADEPRFQLLFPPTYVMSFCATEKEKRRALVAFIPKPIMGCHSIVQSFRVGREGFIFAKLLSLRRTGNYFLIFLKKNGQWEIPKNKTKAQTNVI